MTSPSRQAEADRVEEVYYWALAQIGARTLEEAFVEFEDVPASERAATAVGWLSRAVALVMRRRSQAREVAITYYRLVRALRTGYTVQRPGKSEPATVTLEILRREFDAMVDEVEQEALSAPESASQRPAGTDTPAADGTVPDPVLAATERPSDPEPSDDDDDIILEQIRELDALIAAQDEQAEKEAADLLDELGIEKMLSELREIDDAQDAATVQAQAEEARRRAAQRQAVQAERISLNAARGLIYSIGPHDPRVLGYVRFSRTGTPCGWCAMLISRKVLYKSKKSASLAGIDSRFDEFHPNCHCVAVPVFSREQFDNSPLFNQNREYAALWPKVSAQAAANGENVMTAWRRHFRTQQAQAA